MSSFVGMLEISVFFLTGLGGKISLGESICLHCLFNCCLFSLATRLNFCSACAILIKVEIRIALLVPRIKKKNKQGFHIVENIYFSFGFSIVL